MDGPVTATSQAEFRDEAHRIYDRHTASDITLRIYFTWCGLGLFSAVLLFSLYGLTITLGAGWGVLVGLAGIGLIGWRIRRQFAQGAAMREAIRAQSRRVDELVAAGQLPVVPEGQAGEVLPPPHERGRS